MKSLTHLILSVILFNQTVQAQTPYLLKDIFQGPTPSQCNNGFFPYKDGVFFFAEDSLYGMEPWWSGGSPSTTFRLKDINPLANSSCDPIQTPFLFNKDLYFVANDGVHGLELWKTNSTSAGTVLIKDIRPGNANGLIFYNYSFFISGANLYFVADDGVHGYELWKTDGTTAGTVMVKDINPGINSGVGEAKKFWENNGYFYFLACDTAEYFYDLWKSDGTGSGTSLVKKFYGSGLSSYDKARPLNTLNNELIFVANDGISGDEHGKRMEPP